MFRDPAREADRDGRILAFGLAAFAAIFGARLVSSNPADAVGMLYVVPVALLAANFGTRAGILAGALAFALLVVSATIADVAVGPLGYATRAATMTFVGGAVGRIVQERQRVERQSTRWFEMSNSMLCEATFSGYFTSVNGAWTETLGYSRQELLTRPLECFVHPDDRERTRRAVASLAGGPADLVSFENRQLAKDGSWRWLLWSARSDDERIYAVAKDITDRKRLEEEREELLARVEAMARTDELTGLPNRRAWDDELRRELARSARKGHPVSVVMLDVDRFKRFNDDRGHQAGDEFLLRAALAWRTSLRVTDFIARYGGEEFAVLLPDAAPQEALARLVERLRKATPMNQTCSAGIATWDGHESPDELVGRADAALYEAKRSGRDRLTVASFSPLQSLS